MRFFFITAILSIALTGCAGKQTTIDPDYQAYVATISQQKPLLKLELADDGRIRSIEMNQPIQIQQKQPEAPHPAWGVLSGLIKGATVFGSIWAGGEALQGVIEASRGVTTYTAGGSIAGGDVSIPTTTTTTTTTTETTETSTDNSTYDETNINEQRGIFQ